MDAARLAQLIKATPTYHLDPILHAAAERLAQGHLIDPVLSELFQRLSEDRLAAQRELAVMKIRFLGP